MFAAMLAVPTENYLGELMREIDVDGLHRARGASARRARRRTVRRVARRVPAQRVERTVSTRLAQHRAPRACAISHSASCARRVQRAYVGSSTAVARAIPQRRQPDRSARVAARDRQRRMARRAGACGSDRRFLHALVGAEARHRSVVLGAGRVPPSRRVGARRVARTRTPTSTGAIRTGCARCTARLPGRIRSTSTRATAPAIASSRSALLASIVRIRRLRRDFWRR